MFSLNRCFKVKTEERLFSQNYTEESQFTGVYAVKRNPFLLRHK